MFNWLFNLLPEFLGGSVGLTAGETALASQIPTNIASAMNLGKTAAQLGPTMQSASMLSKPSLFSRGLAGVVSGQGALPGMGMGASDLLSKGLGKMGMEGTSDFLAENPIRARVNFGNTQPNAVALPQRNNLVGQQQQNGFKEMLSQEIDDLVKKAIQSQSRRI